MAAYELNAEMGALINALITSRHLPSKKDKQRVFRMGGRMVAKSANSADLAVLCDVLCHNAGLVGDLATAREFGLKSLHIKDRLSANSAIAQQRPRPEFDYINRSRNIISFSLFGTQERYTRIAIENAKAVSFVYPGWMCRYYVDNSVPKAVLDDLSQLGAQIFQVPQPHDLPTASGLFWRFYVASDPNIDYFLVRDVDSLINVREKVAVDEWIASNCNFHVMRDFYTHSELILAGMWGGVAGMLPNIRQQVQDFQSNNAISKLGVHNLDQQFLRSKIWPMIKGSLMQHDSVFGFKGARPFPTVGAIEPIRHVGQNMGIFLN